MLNRRIEQPPSGSKVPQSARDYHREHDNHSLRNFSGSPSRRVGSEGRTKGASVSKDVRSPNFDSGQPNLVKKQHSSFAQSPDRKTTETMSMKKSQFGDT